MAHTWSSIEFRRVERSDGAYGPSVTTGVEPVIDGEPLTHLWHQRSGASDIPVRHDLVVWPGHRLWRPEPALHDELGVDDRRVVLLCADGLTGCGGATARISFHRTDVTWSDFRAVPDDFEVDLGPFRFRRQLYEAALERVERHRH